MNRNETKGIMSLALAGFLYSFYGIYSRIMGQNFAPFYQAWSRALIHIGILFLIIYFFKKWKKLRKNDLIWFFCIGICGGLIDVLTYISFIKLSIGTTLFLLYAFSTIFSYIWGTVFYKERITKVKLISIITALLGTFLLYWGQMQFVSGDIVYLIFASLSGIMVSIFTTFNKKISSHYSVFQITGVSNVIGFPILFICSLLMKEQWYMNFQSLPWIVNIFFALTQIVIVTLIIYGFRRIEVQKGSLLLLLELVFGVVWGITLYHEIPNPILLFGGILILLALLLPLLNFKFLRKNNT